jgi:hypothetical protein
MEFPTCSAQLTLDFIGSGGALPSFATTRKHTLSSPILRVGAKLPSFVSHIPPFSPTHQDKRGPEEGMGVEGVIGWSGRCGGSGYL